MYPTKYDELTNSLVFAMLAIKLVDFEPSKQDEIVQSCSKVYSEFTLSFFTQNYPEFELNNIPDIGKSKLKDLHTISKLKPKLDLCYKAFLGELSKNWEI
jgi:hypothetical protein